MKDRRTLTYMVQNVYNIQWRSGLVCASQMNIPYYQKWRYVVVKISAGMNPFLSGIFFNSVQTFSTNSQHILVADSRLLSIPNWNCDIASWCDTGGLIVAFHRLNNDFKKSLGITCNTHSTLSRHCKTDCDRKRSQNSGVISTYCTIMRC